MISLCQRMHFVKFVYLPRCRINRIKVLKLYNQSLLAPMAIEANALILAAIWTNLSLRTPSYVLLAGLAFTDFCTGLLTQPFYVLNKLGEMTGRVNLSCIALHCTALGYYLNPFMF